MRTIKIDVNVPKWAKYIAQDKDGKLFFYSGIPKIGKYGWESGGIDVYFQFIADGNLTNDWKESLVKL
jgi:hypothetical protein